MSDFSDGPEEFEGSPSPESDELSDFVSNAAETALDPAACVTIKTSGGSTRYVPVPEGNVLTVNDVMAAASLRYTTSSEIWLNGAQIKAGDPVPAGSSLIVVDSVKGG